MHLSKPVRDELRMTAAIRCYSMLQQGKVMKVKDLQLRISDLFHGNTLSSIPSQIHLLSTASFTYRNLYEQKNRVVTRKDASKASSQITILKHQLSMDRTRSYEVGRDIITSDLEKKTNCFHGFSLYKNKDDNIHKSEAQKR